MQNGCLSWRQSFQNTTRRLLVHPNFWPLPSLAPTLPPPRSQVKASEKETIPDTIMNWGILDRSLYK